MALYAQVTSVVVVLFQFGLFKQFAVDNLWHYSEFDAAKKKFLSGFICASLFMALLFAHRPSTQL